MRKIERILLWVDNTAESKIAAKYAFELSRTYGAKIIAMYCIDNLVVERISQLSSKTRGEIEVELEENAWKYLYYLEELATHEGIPFTITLTKGNLVDEIMKHIEKLHIDLLVLKQSKRQTKRHQVINELMENLTEYSPAMVLLIDQFSN